MEEKLERLFKESLKELEQIGISFENLGKIDISISKRNNKRYGCCKQEEPDKKTKYKYRKKIYYSCFKIHHIEISKWVLDLNDDIIKNTIIHELIHCLPNCNNHGKEFKMYASIVNEKLGYNISRLGNKEADFRNSNIEYKIKTKDYKYKIICTVCNQLYYRKRISKDFLLKYRCGKCKGKLKILEK